MAYETILVESKNRVGVITFNRPKALNALCAQLISELNDALDGYEADAGIKAIVITGSERAFAAGADISEMQDKDFIAVTGLSQVDVRAADFPKKFAAICKTGAPLTKFLAESLGLEF